MNESKKPFSSRFVDEQKFITQASLNTRRKYYLILLFIPILTLLIGLTSTMFGLDFAFSGSRIFLFVNLIILSVTIFMLIWLMKSEKKNNIFKKRSYLVFFNIPFYTLMIGSVVFSIIFSEYEDLGQGYTVSLNPFFFFCIHLPLFIFYMLFLVFAYLKLFRQYSYGKKSKEVGYDF